MSTKKLSDRQKNILKYIEEYVDERGYPPSIREIGDRVGISSTSVVDYNLRVLEREGRIRRDREVSRGLELVSAQRRERQHATRGHREVVGDGPFDHGLSRLPALHGDDPGWKRSIVCTH